MLENPHGSGALHPIVSWVCVVWSLNGKRAERCQCSGVPVPVRVISHVAYRIINWKFKLKAV